MSDESPVFRDRRDAGAQLGSRLAGYRGRDDVLVLGIPRGGVPVAYEVAVALGAPLDVIVVRKLGLPFQPELAMGAIASGGVRVLNAGVVGDLGIPDRVIEEVAARESAELERRERLFRGGLPELDPAGRCVIVVDDGLATGSSMRAAIAGLRERRAASVIVAVPVGPPSTCREIAALADTFVCLSQPTSLMSVGEWYEDFSQTTDGEVQRLLEARAASASRPPGRRGSGPRSSRGRVNTGL